MDIVHKRSVGMDISKRDAKVCIRVPGKRTSDESYAAVVQSAGEIQEVFHAPAQAVQLPHHQGVTFA